MSTFTVACFSGTTSGSSRGQSFTPNVPGPDGTGGPGAANPVYLQSVTIGYPSSSTTGRASCLCLYDTLPSLSDLNSGLDSAVSTQTSDESGVFGSNTYSRTFTFAPFAIDPSKEYFLLFEVNQTLRVATGNPYSGGKHYNTSLISTTIDVQFKVTMSDS